MPGVSASLPEASESWIIEHQTDIPTLSKLTAQVSDLLTKPSSSWQMINPLAMAMINYHGAKNSCREGKPTWQIAKLLKDLGRPSRIRGILLRSSQRPAWAPFHQRCGMNILHGGPFISLFLSRPLVTPPKTRANICHVFCLPQR
jgi:hypothetical protein